MINPPDFFDICAEFDEHMKRKAERNRRVMTLLFGETGLDENKKIVVPCGHEATNETSKENQSQSQSGTSSPERNAGE